MTHVIQRVVKLYEPLAKTVVLGASASIMVILAKIWLASRDNTNNMAITLITNSKGENLTELIVFATLAAILTMMMIDEFWNFYKKLERGEY